MTKNMLIDATHAEETRVAVVDNGRLVEFDYESKVRKPLKSSIFLAKVTRVEPSLQAAFVNFGGNRHGFLPFSEIHPDYFRIPVADREALIEAQKAALEEHDEEFEDGDDEDAQDNGKDDAPDDENSDDDAVVELGGADQPADEDDEDDASDPNGNVKEEEPTDDEDNTGNTKNARGGRNGRGRNNNRGGRGRNGRSSNARSGRREKYEDDGGDRPFRFNLRRQYKIQEVIKRGQIMLVQVSKEERGNKGAAVTSYLSLPGRYCVLMPNSPRGGGVSRKIASFKDRRRMREILKELEVPEGMSVILRTAGVERTKTEIKRDLDYLMRLWDNIRELTLKSTAPALVYEEADLIKRAIRDLYARDIDDVHVAGNDGFKATKDFMKMMMPSHVKRVKEYKDSRIPLFHAHKVESQITEIGETTVTLKSGGYLVINPTEALISVDVNSGRATKERHIEETALKTNLESAEEVARQLRLRDLGGLVVIDFIDMEDRRNNRKVENRLRDALSSDRARIQVGRISSFGLLELSRQRLNPSLTETQFMTCPHCDGAGHIRTLDGSVIIALRALEDEGIKGGSSKIILNVPNDMAVYLLNNKRKMLVDIEQRHDLSVEINIDESLAPAGYRIETFKGQAAPREEESGEAEMDSSNSDDNDKRGGNRKRGRRGGRRRNAKRNESGDDQKPENNAEAGKTDKDHKESKPKRAPRKKAESSKDDKKPAKKPAAKKTETKKVEPTKKPAAKKADDKPEKAKKPVKKVSNDTKKEPVAKDYEKVNEAPAKKKKGWWSKASE